MVIKLDISDMERRIVDFRLNLDREKRRCQQAKMMDIFEKLLKDKLGEESSQAPNQRALNAIKLDRLDTEGFRRLANFLKGTIELCNQFEQHEQFQNVVRDVLQTARRKLVRAAAEAGRDPALEPFCLFCGTSPHEAHHLGCHHQRGSLTCGASSAITTINNNQLHDGGGALVHLPLQNGATSGPGSATGEAYTPQMYAQERPLGIATPPPSAATTPDVLERPARELDTSIQRLKGQFNRSFSYTPLAAGSSTPPMSANVAAAQLLQQQQQARVALEAAASQQQQVNSTTGQQQAQPYGPAAPNASQSAPSGSALSDTNSADQLAPRPPPPQLNAANFERDSESDHSYLDGEGPDSVRSALDRVDQLDLDEQRLRTQRRSSTPLGERDSLAEEQPSSELIIDEQANLSQERELTPIKPAAAALLKRDELAAARRIKSQPQKSLEGSLVKINLLNKLPGGRSKQQRADLSAALSLNAIPSSSTPNGRQHQHQAGQSGHNTRAPRALRIQAQSPPPLAQGASRTANTSGAGRQMRQTGAPSSTPATAPLERGSQPTIEIVGGPAARLARAAQPSPASSRIEEAERRAARGGPRTKTTRRKVSSQMKQP